MLTNARQPALEGDHTPGPCRFQDGLPDGDRLHALDSVDGGWASGVYGVDEGLQLIQIHVAQRIGNLLDPARLAPVDYYRAAARVRRRQAGKIGAGTSFEENRTLRADHIVQVAAPRPRGQAPRPRDDEFIAVFEANDRRPRIDSSCVRAKRHATGHHLRGLAERVTGKVVVVDGPVEERAVSLALLHEPAF